MTRRLVSEAASARRSLPDLQRSNEAGLRLAAIACLQTFPDANHLDWLATRLDPELEKPFVGYQAAIALRQAVRKLPSGNIPQLKDALTRAKQLAERIPDDPPRLNVLNLALQELARRNSEPAVAA